MITSLHTGISSMSFFHDSFLIADLISLNYQRTQSRPSRPSPTSFSSSLATRNPRGTRFPDHFIQNNNTQLFPALPSPAAQAPSVTLSLPPHFFRSLFNPIHPHSYLQPHLLHLYSNSLSYPAHFRDLSNILPREDAHPSARPACPASIQHLVDPGRGL